MAAKYLISSWAPHGRLCGISWIYIFFPAVRTTGSRQIPAAVIGMCRIFLIGRPRIVAAAVQHLSPPVNYLGWMALWCQYLWISCTRPRSVLRPADLLRTPRASLRLLGPVTFASGGERSRQLNGLLVCITGEPVTPNGCAHQSFRRRGFRVCSRFKIKRQLLHANSPRCSRLDQNYKRWHADTRTDKSKVSVRLHYLDSLCSDDTVDLNRNG